MKSSQALAVLAFVAVAVDAAAVPVPFPVQQTVSNIKIVDSEPASESGSEAWEWEAGKSWKRDEADNVDSEQSDNISFPYESPNGIYHLYSDGPSLKYTLATDKDVDLSGGYKEVFTIPKDTPVGKAIYFLAESNIEYPIPPMLANVCNIIGGKGCKIPLSGSTGP